MTGIATWALVIAAALSLGVLVVSLAIAAWTHRAPRGHEEMSVKEMGV